MCVFHLHTNDTALKKKALASKRRKDAKTIKKIVDVLGRIYGQNPPAVFGAPQ